MSHMKELVIVDDKEELAYLIGQEKIVGQTLRTSTVVENQNSILIMDEEIVSQNDWNCDKEEENFEDCTGVLGEIPDEADMSQVE